MHCKSLWIKASAKCINVNVNVKRESSWGKLINKQVTRWVGSRQIDMRAQGTQKTRTEATCSHKTKTQAHGQQTNHQPCLKQDMRTWKHAANEKHKLRATQQNTHGQKSVRPSETRDRTLPQRDRTWSTSVRTPTWNRNSRHECRDPNTTLQHETQTWW